MAKRALWAFALAVVCSGCPSAWKIHGGPMECMRMCKSWNLQFAGMVGVGSQDSYGDGATACVCQVGSFAPQASSDKAGGAMSGGATSASMAAPISAAEAAAAAAAAQRQMQMQQSTMAAGAYH
jgi:hypothetical protein